MTGVGSNGWDCKSGMSFLLGRLLGRRRIGHFSQGKGIAKQVLIPCAPTWATMSPHESTAMISVVEDWVVEETGPCSSS
jgi:hypothetical protein